MLQKGRAPAMSHVARTHRVNLDWLLERLHIDDSIYCRYVESKHQLADILTKPGFTKELWCNLLEQWRISPPPVAKPKAVPSANFVCSELTARSPTPSSADSHLASMLQSSSSISSSLSAASSSSSAMLLLCSTDVNFWAPAPGLAAESLEPTDSRTFTCD